MAEVNRFLILSAGPGTGFCKNKKTPFGAYLIQTALQALRLKRGCSIQTSTFLIR